MRNNNVDFEQLISFHPSFKSLGDQPTIRDVVFDYYCKALHDCDKANAETKRYLNEVHEVFSNQRKANEPS